MRHPHRFQIAFGLSLAVGLLGHDLSGAQAQTDERGIYQAVMASIFNGKVPTALVVTESPLAIRVPVAWQWQQLGVAAMAMQSKVEAQAGQSTPAAFLVEWFPAGTKLVPYEEIAQVFRTAPRGADPGSAWIPFRSRFGVETYQGFSLPVLSDDQLSALVWYSHACGSLCGNAGYVWLQRPSPTAAWVLVKRLPVVAS